MDCQKSLKKIKEQLVKLNAREKALRGFKQVCRKEKHLSARSLCLSNN